MALSVAIDTRDLEVVGRRLIVGAEKGRAIAEAAMPEIAEKVGIIGTDSIADVTPVVTGELKGATTHEAEVEGLKATVFIKQPLEVSSQVNTWILSELLIKGHDIVTKSRRVVGHVAPNPYPDQAKDTIESEIQFLLEYEARSIIRSYASAL